MPDWLPVVGIQDNTIETKCIVEKIPTARQNGKAALDSMGIS